MEVQQLVRYVIDGALESVCAQQREVAASQLTDHFAKNTHLRVIPSGSTRPDFRNQGSDGVVEDFFL